MESAMRNSLLLAIVALSLFYGRAASADVRLCNNTDREIWANWGEISQGNFRSGDFIIGWYHIQPHQCATPISGAVCNFAANVFGNCYWQYAFFANDAFGKTWGGSTSICTSNSGFNEYPHYGTGCDAPRVRRDWGLGSFPSGPLSDFTLNFNP
jgi:uncharacterized membrane protein